MKKYALLIAMLCGCEGLTTPPQPALSVLKRMPEGCFALMTPDAPPADALHLYGLCSYQADATLMANVDEAVVVIDYGPDVEFDATSAVPPPVVTVTIDGAPADVVVTVGDVQRAGSRAFFEATLRAPAQLSSDVRISASVNAGFAASVEQPFAIVAPPVGLSLAECPDPASCELAGAVGDAHLVIAIPGDLPQSVVIHSQIDVRRSRIRNRVYDNPGRGIHDFEDGFVASIRGFPADEHFHFATPVGSMASMRRRP